MLTGKDKEWIREAFRAELKEALNRKITVERGPRQQGDPEKTVKEEEWNVLDFLAIYLPRIEGVMRGMQEDVDKAKNKVGQNTEALHVVGNTLLGLEDFTLKMGKFVAAAEARGLLEAPEEPKKLRAVYESGA